MLSDITEAKLEQWIRLGIRQISYKDLKHAIENRVYADNILFNHLSWLTTKNKMTRAMFRAMLRLHWNLVEKYLCNMDFLYKTLTEDRPDFKQLLSGREAKHWLFQCARRAYDKLYYAAWC